MRKPKILVTGATGKTGRLVAALKAMRAEGLPIRRPFPLQPQFSPDSEVWRREHGIDADAQPSMAGARRVPP